MHTIIIHIMLFNLVFSLLVTLLYNFDMLYHFINFNIPEGLKTRFV